MEHFLKPELSRPRDFALFWAKTWESLMSTDPEVRCEPAPAHGADDDELLTLSFKSLGGVRVAAYAILWRNREKRPLVVHSHGYGSSCGLQWNWARSGYNVVGVDIRGFGWSRAAVPHLSKWGYVLTGIETPETSVLRGAVCDYAQAVRVAQRLCEGTITKTVLHGFSFSGALALMAGALPTIVDLLALGVPTFGWAEGRNFFVKVGSGAEIGRYLEARPEEAEDVMLVLRYFDPVNFADTVSCPTLLGIGLKDDVVPAKTVYAIANHLQGPVEILEFPFSHSDEPEEKRWEEFEARWLELGKVGATHLRRPG
jgi:cephalosporin-C deacetylase